MSGGLVSIFRDKQTVAACGVVSADFSSDEARKSFTYAGESIAASTWPMLALPVPSEISDKTEWHFILEMMRLGRMPVAVGGIDGFDVVDRGGGDVSLVRK